MNFKNLIEYIIITQRDENKKYMSNFLNLLKNDYVKGLLMTVIGAILTALYDVLQSGGVIDIQKVLLGGVLAGLSYLIKNFFSDSNGKFMGKI